jgi:hypothetical protein
VPALIAAAGEQAGWRYVQFFTAKQGRDRVAQHVSQYRQRRQRRESGLRRLRPRD